MTPADTPSEQPRGERELIRQLSARLCQSLTPPPAGTLPVAFGDDMALLSADTTPLLWTVDMLMDGIDFDSTRHTWREIGRKAMAVNLSDCAAMAVRPVAALCAVALANTLTMDAALELLHAAHECGLRFDCPVVGGDTNSWNAPTAISITVAGHALPDAPPVPRTGARPDDRIWLTGTVGGSILGRHLSFEPRIEMALEINRQLRPHAMIDVSDGLALDLDRILEASRCGAVLDDDAMEAVIHPDAERLAAQDGHSAREHALYDGEDFELIVVLPPDAPEDACAALGLRPLGRITAEHGLFQADAAGRRRPIPIRGWEHFR